MTENVQKAMDWAICFLDLPQFKWTKYDVENRFNKDMLDLFYMDCEGI